MELPQSSPFRTAQARKATHDFLSLYGHSSLQQDPRPPHGGFLKTHNFLQPLEGEEKLASREDNSVNMNIEKLPSAAPSTAVVEHLLPGGIGTYSINHISYFNPRVPKPEDNVFDVAPVASNDKNDDNSNCSSYTGSGFTLWDESAVRKGNTGKENSSDVNIVEESPANIREWPLDRPSQSSSNHRSSVSPFSSSQTLSQKNQSFMEMIKSAKGPHSVDEDEEDVSLKKESSSSQKGELRVKVDAKCNDQKPNTPRSKHSATEQRRRCKINHRFQMLRELIPHSDQKRDKASFLLEVIEYIQCLQEKVNRYEGSYPGWNNEPVKLTSWRNSHGPSESLMDQPRVINGVASPVVMFGPKLDEKASAAPLNIPRNPQIPAESSVASAMNFRTIDQQSGMSNKAVSSSSPLKPDAYAPIRNGCALTQPPATPLSDGDNASHLRLWQNWTPPSEPSSVGADQLKAQEFALEGGTINISSAYSQGLLNTLTRALQTSGVDLSHASISVQVDIGKRANNRKNEQKSLDKVAEVANGNQVLFGARAEKSSDESDHAIKRLKTG